MKHDYALYGIIIILLWLGMDSLDYALEHSLMRAPVECHTDTECEATDNRLGKGY